MSEQNIDIDMDFLISLVQERPIIWDKSHEHYSDKFRKANEWADVCKKLFQGYEEFEDQKNNKMGKVVKKWRSVKDNFFRYVKKIKENNSSGSGAKQLKKYHYYNQLLFLMKVTQNKTDSSLEIMHEETQRNENTTSSPFPTKKITSLPPGPSRYVPASRKRSHQSIDDFEAQTLEALQEKENRHLSFFKGILPSLDGFTELQTLTFQSKVINIITEMRFGEQAVQSTTWQSRGYQTGQQYQATPLQPRGYLTGQHAQSPSPSSYQTDEFETNYSANTTFNNFTDDSQEEDYNFALLPNSNS